MFVGGAVMGALLLGLLPAFFLVPRILRYSLGELGEAARANSKEKMQFSILDIYILIAQIALYSLPTALSAQRNMGVVQSMLLMAAYYTLCWALAVRLLSRARIRAVWPRMVIMVLYPWMITFALYYGIGVLPLILMVFFLPLVPLIAAGAFVLAAMFFRAVSQWALSKRERVQIRQTGPVIHYPVGDSMKVPEAPPVLQSNTDDDLRLQMPTGTDGR